MPSLFQSLQVPGKYGPVRSLSESGEAVRRAGSCQSRSGAVDLLGLITRRGSAPRQPATWAAGRPSTDQAATTAQRSARATARPANAATGRFTGTRTPRHQPGERGPVGVEIGNVGRAFLDDMSAAMDRIAALAAAHAGCLG